MRLNTYKNLRNKKYRLGRISLFYNTRIKILTVLIDSINCCGALCACVAKLTSASMQGWSGNIAAGDGKAGAVPTFSFTASEAGTNGTIPELETESASGATTGEELPAMVERVCGDLKKKRDNAY